MNEELKMKNPILHYYIIVLATMGVIFSGLFSGCSNDKRRLDDGAFIDFAHIATESLKNGGDLTAANTASNEHKDEFDAMLAIMGLDNHNVEAWLKTPAIQAFAHDVDSIMPSNENISYELAYIVSQAEKEGLNIPVKSFATAIWGKPQSIMFADSTMFVALNHYLGFEHPAYSGLPEYRRASKTKENMPYDMAEAMIATAYPFEHTDSSAVINRMIYEGALTAVKMALVKNAKLNEALGYTDEQLQWLEKNEVELWRKMVGSKMIFDLSETVADRLILPSPTTTILSPECPGRAGRYIGYKIVESYLKSQPDVRLVQLLSPNFYGVQNTLTEANYSPR